MWRHTRRAAIRLGTREIHHAIRVFNRIDVDSVTPSSSNVVPFGVRALVV